MSRPASDAFERGDPYDRYIGRWSRRVAPEFLAWLNEPPGRRWLDVGCGTGALCAAIAESCAPASVAGVEPSEGFLATARERLGGRVELHHGSATAIPLADAAVEVVASALVINFVPEPDAALAEMARVASDGGTVAAYVWDYDGRMELLRIFWDAAVALDPDAASFDEGVRFPLCRPEPLRELFERAGLARVDVRAIDVPTPFADFDDYWQPFLAGQGPAPAYVLSLEEPARASLRERLRLRLPRAADGSITMIARAWAVRGTVAR